MSNSKMFTLSLIISLFLTNQILAINGNENNPNIRSKRQMFNTVKLRNALDESAGSDNQNRISVQGWHRSVGARPGLFADAFKRQSKSFESAGGSWNSNQWGQSSFDGGQWGGFDPGPSTSSSSGYRHIEGLTPSETANRLREHFGFGFDLGEKWASWNQEERYKQKWKPVDDPALNSWRHIQDPDEKRRQRALSNRERNVRRAKVHHYNNAYEDQRKGWETEREKKARKLYNQSIKQLEEQKELYKRLNEREKNIEASERWVKRDKTNSRAFTRCKRSLDGGCGRSSTPKLKQKFAQSAKRKMSKIGSAFRKFG